MTRRRPNKEGAVDPGSEDDALWAHVARTVTRLESLRRANRPIADDRREGDHPRRMDPAVQKSSATALPPTPRALAHAKIDIARMPGPSAMEPRKVKRVAKGRDEIDARVDLHGLRQGEAHGVLRAFLIRAHNNGHRLVLVITGKGKPDDVDRHAPFDLFQDRDRGVLRRNVPRWLSEPDLRSVVVGHTSAHAKHGGDGAFYVQLRNRDKYRG
jgi:DNA-nicking Smr family endonuclease